MADPTMAILAERLQHEARVADLLHAAERLLNVSDHGTAMAGALVGLNRTVRALRHSELFDRRQS